LSDEAQVALYILGVNGFELENGLHVRLGARIQASFRDYTNSEGDTLRAGNLIYEIENQRTTVNNILVLLSPIESKLLYIFLQREGKVHTREALIRGVWKNKVHIDHRTVDVAVGRLRKALTMAAVENVTIEAVRGFGYRASW
jgi:two-component system phosphate regulon response regulator PhoB